MDSEEISFNLNGKQHIVPHTVHPATRLSDYIRQTALLKGTKVTCREGGCGVCVVTAEYTDHVTGKLRTRAINSCLCPLHIVKGWNITTTEGLGSKHDGYHPIQKRMADHSATQCGFCTPGFVMSMYGLLKDKPEPSCDDVTKSLDGNLCRCTGYRSIMDAFQSFTSDGQNAKAVDIEDIQKLPCTKNVGNRTPRVSNVIFKNWRRPQSLSELYHVLESNNQKKNRLVFGNTASGVYKKDRYDMFINIRDIPELYVLEADDKFLDIGANFTLTELQEIFADHKQKRGFEYLDKLAAHIDLIGNTPVRNAGTWAGNLIMQREHPDFLSDMLPPLEALGVQICIGGSSKKTCVTAEGLLSVDMTGKVVLSMRLPALSEQETFSVYKVALRPQSSHAYVTAAFKLSFSDLKTHTIQEAKLVYGGLCSEGEQHAVSAERCLSGKSIESPQAKTECLKILAGDMKVSTEGLFPVEYRTHLAQNLLFKFLCQFGSNGISPPASRLERPVSSGKQDYETKPEEFPVTNTLAKISGTLQTAGEAVFLDDLPKFDRELAALIVHSTIAKGRVDTIDTRAALSIDGVVDVLTDDSVLDMNPPLPEQVLFKDVAYNGQPIAIVLAEDLGLAYRGAAMVKVTYKDIQKPILTAGDAIKEEYGVEEIPPIKTGDTKAALKNCAKVIEGTFEHGSQYHFYVENQGCLVVPKEGTYEVWSSTQSTDGVQQAIAKALGVVSSSVQVTVPRVGGGFGGKTNNSATVAVLAAISSAKTNRPVRLALSLEASMRMTGHRPDVEGYYKIGVDDQGMIQAMENKLYYSSGHTPAFFHTFFVKHMITHSDGVYYIPNTLGRGFAVKTDAATSSAMRSPGQVPASLFAEHVIGHVAHVLGVDPIAYKQKHLCRKGQVMLCGLSLPDDNATLLWEAAMKSADVQNRQKQIEAFNKEHKWVKRGLAATPGKFLVTYMPSFTFTSYMAVYHHDGSVVISHGGVEFGQGLDTKVTQVAMKELGLAQKLIKVVRTNTLTAPNTCVTAGSMTAEYLCRTVQECCKSILKKLAPVREENPGADWQTIISKANAKGIHLAAMDRYVSPVINALDYTVLGVCVAEAEVDILTGENNVLRADMHMDIGQSVNPEIDVGQIEGALITGLGMMLREKEILDPKTGQLLTATTWDYKIPTAVDIPADFRISLMKGKPNPTGVFSSKAVGEPPICCSPVFLHAVKAAVTASRKERGKAEYFDLFAPATPDSILKACDVNLEDLR